MGVTTLQPLDRNNAIVDAKGIPTQYFIRLLQDRGILQGGDHDELVAAIAAIAALQAINILAGVALDGGGQLTGDVTIDHADSAVTPGTYGSSTKSAVITVDQQGHVTDVTEATISGGGGGGGPWWFDPPTTAVFTPWQVSGSEIVEDDADAGMIILQPVNSVDTPLGALKAIPSPGTSWFAQMRIDTFVDGFPTSTSYSNRSLVVTDGTNHKAAWWGPDNRQVMHYMHLFADTGAYDGYETFVGMPYMPHWWRFDYDAATGILTHSVSASGKRWVVCGSENVKSYLGVDPQYIGFLVNTSVSNIGAEMVINHYSDNM